MGLNGDSEGLEPALADHQATLEARIQELAATVAKVSGFRADLARGQVPTLSSLAQLMKPGTETHVAFDLPWPWGGERFELPPLGVSFDNDACTSAYAFQLLCELRTDGGQARVEIGTPFDTPAAVELTPASPVSEKM